MLHRLLQWAWTVPLAAGVGVTAHHVAGSGGSADSADARVFVVATYQVQPELRFVERMGVGECLVRAGMVFEEPEPELAQRWERLPAGRWRFHLRRGVRFHDGSPVDAAAAARAIERFQRTADGAGTSDELRPEVVDAHTLDVVARSASLPVPGYLGRATVLAETSYDAAGRLVHPVGTGPFRVVRVEWGEQVVLEANDLYRGGPPELRRIVVREVRDPSTRVVMLESNEAQWIHMVPRHEVARLEAAGHQVAFPPFLYDVFLACNTRSGPAAERSVRRAMAHAINVDALVGACFSPGARPAMTLLPRDVASVPADLPFHRFDRAEAERILDDAGWRRPAPGAARVRDGRTLSLTISTVGETYRPNWPAAVELLRQDLQRVGIECAVRVLEREAWTAALGRGEFDATLLGRMPGWFPDPLAWFDAWYTTGARNNVPRFCDPRFDAAVAAGLDAAEDDSRLRALHEAQRVLASELPLVPLAHDQGHEIYALRPEVDIGDDPRAARTAFPGPATRLRGTGPQGPSGDKCAIPPRPSAVDARRASRTNSTERVVR